MTVDDSLLARLTRRSDELGPDDQAIEHIHP